MMLKLSSRGKSRIERAILKSRLILELSKASGYLEWIEGVRNVLEKVQGYTSDLLIADTLKKSLKIKRDSTDRFPCKTTIEILEVMKKNYVLDGNLFIHLFRPIGALKDPVNKYQTQVNCKQVALLLNRIKNRELIVFIREDDVTLFEGKTIMGDRRGVYIQEKERHRLEG